MIVYELIIYTPDGDWDRSNIMTSKIKAIAIARDAAGT